MLWEHNFDLENGHDACKNLVSAWQNDPTAKVFVLRANQKLENVQSYYQSIFPSLGSPRAYAEDVGAGDRNNQRTGHIWMEVRYDPKFPDAYRHSSNAQPLHTDGSYIPGYPNSTLLACVENAGVGGETTFLDLPDLVTILEYENPELLQQLRTVVVPHSRSGDSRISRILEGEGENARIYWNYYCVAKDANELARNVAEKFHKFLDSSAEVKKRTLPVKLGPGDGVLWKDDELLHGRNGFKATQTSERFIWKCAFDVGVFP
jgi:alpha-ketoglutarate-dependent taurine dioxygenase